MQPHKEKSTRLQGVTLAPHTYSKLAQLLRFKTKDIIMSTCISLIWNPTVVGASKFPKHFCIQLRLLLLHGRYVGSLHYGCQNR